MGLENNWDFPEEFNDITITTWNQESKKYIKNGSN